MKYARSIYNFFLQMFAIVMAVIHDLIAASPFGMAPCRLGANTLSASLILDTLSKRTQTVIGNQLAPIGFFAGDFSEDVMNQGQAVQVPIATAGGTAQTDPTNWESGDTTIGNRPVVVHQYSVSFHLTPLQTNNSYRMAQIMDINVQNFVHAISDAASAIFNGTHWTNFIQAAATFSATNLKTIRAGIARSPQRNILLDPTYYANFLPASLSTELGPKAGLAGFDAFAEVTRWTGAGTNAVGFAGGPQCVAYVAGLPVIDPELGSDINSTVIPVEVFPGKTMSVQASSWISRATRLRWASLDVMFGVGRLDNSVGYLIKSGGTA